MVTTSFWKFICRSRSAFALETADHLVDELVGDLVEVETGELHVLQDLFAHRSFSFLLSTGDVVVNVTMFWIVESFFTFVDRSPALRAALVLAGERTAKVVSAVSIVMRRRSIMMVVVVDRWTCGRSIDWRRRRRPHSLWRWRCFVDNEPVLGDHLCGFERGNLTFVVGRT
jgi:hypothetical protein